MSYLVANNECGDILIEYEETSRNPMVGDFVSYNNGFRVVLVVENLTLNHSLEKFTCIKTALKRGVTVIPTGVVYLNGVKYVESK